MTAFLRQPQNFASPYDVTSLPNHYKGSTLTLCACLYAISPIDGTVKAATSWSRDLTGVPGYPGVTFKSTGGVSASNVEGQQGQAPTNMELNFFLMSAGISEADALAGKWTHALCTVFVTNYEAVKMGQYITHRGYFGQMRQMGAQIAIEIMGFNAALSQMYGKVSKFECSHQFCDAGCGLTLASFTVTGALTAITSQVVFRDSSRTEANDAFGNGIITFLTGSNAGYSFHIDAYDNSTKQFSLRTPTPYLPVIGDTYSAVIGCRKRHMEDCVTRFSNVVHYSGFPWIPTLEEMNRLPIVA